MPLAPVSAHRDSTQLSGRKDNSTICLCASLLRSLGLRDGSLIKFTGRRGLQNGKIVVPKLFAPPPPLKSTG